jgi:CRP-like cAMP-binding protein
LTPGEISDLLGESEKCSFAPGSYIIKEGNGGSHMYVMLNGEAKVLKTGRDGEVELAQLKAADSFGETALADNEQRSASVVAKTPCVLVRINAKTVNSRPEIGLKVYQNLAKVLAKRLRTADHLLAWRLDSSAEPSAPAEQEAVKNP